MMSISIFIFNVGDYDIDIGELIQQDRKGRMMENLV